MKIKVQCPCGSRFEFEAEPVDGKMPWAINCPTCNADATALANEIIHSQIAAAPKRLVISKPHATSHAAGPAPSSATPPPPPPPPAAGNLRMAAHAAHASAPPQATTNQPFEVPSGRTEKPRRPVVKRKRGGLVLGITGAVVVLAGLGVWGWYAFVGSLPAKVYSTTTTKGSDAEPVYHMVAPGQLVSLAGDSLALFDVKQKKELWSVSTAAQTAAAPSGDTRRGRYSNTNRADTATATPVSKTNAAAKPSAPAGSPQAIVDAATAKTGAGAVKSNVPSAEILAVLASLIEQQPGQPTVLANTNDIWVLYPNRVAHFDAQSGTRKEEVDLKAPVLSISHNEDSILAVSQPDATHKVVTQISLTGGSTQSQEIDLAPPKPVRAVATAPVQVPRTGKSPTPAPAPVAAPPVVNRRSRGGGPAVPPANAATPAAVAGNTPPLDHASAQFIPCGPNATEIIVKLVEHLTATSDALKPKGKSILESGNLTASQSMDAAQEMMNDMKRQNGGGKKIEDVSRYQVTLHRLFVTDAPDWTGEVIGAPALFPMKTVDVLASGKLIQVFDKSNHKLWESKLTYPITTQPHTDDGGNVAPCLEYGDTLYFADKGMLSAFAMGGGEAKWRLTSVGISRIQTDEHGDVYLNTTSADPDTIQFSEEVDLKNRPHPVILKVDPKTGKTLWKAENVGENCLLSGKFVYATRSSSSYSWLHLEEGPQTHYNVYRLNPANGHTLWNYYQPTGGVRTEASQNWLMLQLGDSVQVVKYLTF